MRRQEEADRLGKENGTLKKQLSDAKSGQSGTESEVSSPYSSFSLSLSLCRARWDAAAVAAELGWQRAERTEKRAEEFTASWEMTGARELWEGERREQGVGEVEVGFRCGV